MAGDFQLKPTWVKIKEPKYNTVITQSESMKKEYRLIATTPTEQFVLQYEGLSDANFKVLYDHYKSCYGGYDSFDWKNAYIPDYILSALGLTTEDLNGRWVEGSLTPTPKSHSWDCEITSEKSV